MHTSAMTHAGSPVASSPLPNATTCHSSWDSVPHIRKRVLHAVVVIIHTTHRARKMAFGMLKMLVLLVGSDSTRRRGVVTGLHTRDQGMIGSEQEKGQKSEGEH